MSKCKHCDQGHAPKNGTHFIVKSVFPAKMNIVKCKNAEKPEAPSHD